MAFKKDSQYRGCPKIPGMPVEISFIKNNIHIENEWFLDTLIETESPEDEIIDRLDGSDDSSLFVSGKQIMNFDFDELTTSTLTDIEYKIFYAHYIDGETFRALGIEHGCSYKKIFTIYKASMNKLKNAILSMNEEYDG
jgi:DNA-directed RNA polymerase sigma subunit (sigma70/sigma32)